MEKNKTVKIGGASAFWGDTNNAAAQLVHSKQIDYLVVDYLAEITRSILAGAKMKNSELGYATDFVKQVAPLLQDIKIQGIKVVSNAGGINPQACREMLLDAAKKANVELNVAVVEGDNLLDQKDTLQALPVKEMETGSSMPENVMSINA